MTKRFGVVYSTAVLLGLLGLTVPVFAQQKDGHEEGAKPAGQGQEHRQPSQQHAQAQEKPKTSQPQHAQQSQPNRPAQQGQGQHIQQAQQQSRQNQQHAQPGNRDQREQQVASNRGGRIPDDRFRSNFGRSHSFRINRPTIVDGSSRFQYGGYWFAFGQGWPVGWYYTDDVYVDYDGGAYYLYDPIHPGIRISINVL